MLPEYPSSVNVCPFSAVSQEGVRLPEEVWERQVMRKPRAPAAQEQGQQTRSEPGYVQNAPGGTSASRPATDGHLVRLRDRTSRFSDGRVSRWECPSQIKASPLFC